MSQKRRKPSKDRSTTSSSGPVPLKSLAVLNQHHVAHPEALDLDFSSIPSFEVTSCTPETLCFTMSNTTAPIANALRRTMIADIETMAIEVVSISHNSSVMYDEHLSMRLGLLPIACDPLVFAPASDAAFEAPSYNPSHADASSCLLFELNVTGSHVAAGGVTPVLSGDLQWVPLQGQTDPGGPLAGLPPPRLVHPDIPIAKLAAGQSIQLKAVAVRGCGATHAKWSPVCTASFAMESNVALKRPVEGPDADVLAGLCLAGVFDIEEAGGCKRAVVVDDGKACTSCRACVEHPSLGSAVQVGKVKSVYNFTVDSTGALPASTIVSRVREELIECQQSQSARVCCPLSAIACSLHSIK